MKVVYENQSLNGKYVRKVVKTKEAQLQYQAKGWEVAKITELEEELEIVMVKKV